MNLERRLIFQYGPAEGRSVGIPGVENVGSTEGDKDHPAPVGKKEFSNFTAYTRILTGTSLLSSQKLH